MKSIKLTVIFMAFFAMNSYGQVNVGNGGTITGVAPNIITVGFGNGYSEGLKLTTDSWMNFYTDRQKFYFGSEVVFGHHIRAYNSDIFQFHMNSGYLQITADQGTGGYLNVNTDKDNFFLYKPLHIDGRNDSHGANIVSYGSRAMKLSTSSGYLRLISDLGSGSFNLDTDKSNFFFYKPLFIDGRNDAMGANISSFGSNSMKLSSSGGYLQLTTDSKMNFYTDRERFHFSKSADVDGTLKAEEIVVTDVTGADFVFEDDYELCSLEETEKFIDANNHLPEISSAAVMAEEGVSLKTFNIQLLQKIEELTLHVIELNKQLKDQADRIEALEK